MLQSAGICNDTPIVVQQKKDNVSYDYLYIYIMGTVLQKDKCII